MEADIAGGCYMPCQLEGGDVTDEPITYEALSARLLHRPELSKAQDVRVADRIQDKASDVHDPDDRGQDWVAN